MSNDKYSSLTPNSTYYGPHGNAVYHTDEHGRVTDWSAQVSDVREDRNAQAQRGLEGKNPEQSTAGHMLASSQGGSGEKYNMTPQNDAVNTRDYQAFERENAALHQAGYTVSLRGENSFFPGGVNVPDAYMVDREVSMNGEHLYTDHFSWTNTDMSQYENAGAQEVAGLQAQFDNPGAVIDNGEANMAINDGMGQAAGLGDAEESAAPAASGETEGDSSLSDADGLSI